MPRAPAATASRTSPRTTDSPPTDPRSARSGQERRTACTSTLRQPVRGRLRDAHVRWWLDARLAGLAAVLVGERHGQLFLREREPLANDEGGLHDREGCVEPFFFFKQKTAYEMPK